MAGRYTLSACISILPSLEGYVSKQMVKHYFLNGNDNVMQAQQFTLFWMDSAHVIL